MGIGIHFDADDENDDKNDDYDKPLLGRNWIEGSNDDDYDKPLLGRNWLSDLDNKREPIVQPEEEEQESTIHPKNIRVGDVLKVLYKNELISVVVIDEPFEIEELGPDDLGWWQCMIQYKNYPNKLCVIWTEENPVWELGQD